jgi:hypothetical protein
MLGAGAPNGTNMLARHKVAGRHTNLEEPFESRSPDEATTAEAIRRSAVSEPGEPRLSSEGTKQFYPLLAQRNARLSEISDSAAIALSLRSQRLIREQRDEIGQFIWW